MDQKVMKERKDRTIIQDQDQDLEFIIVIVIIALILFKKEIKFCLDIH